MTIDPRTAEKISYVYELTQEQNEIIITSPNCYHWGYNSGFNIAEAINFTSKFWPNETGFIEKTFEDKLISQITPKIKCVG